MNWSYSLNFKAELWRVRTLSGWSRRHRACFGWSNRPSKPLSSTRRTAI